MGISSPGIGSNLDVNGIVSKLMQVESQPLTMLAQQEASYQAKLSAYGSVSGALASFQNTLSSLSDLSKFQQLTSTSSDATIASATTSSTAAAGNYSLNVTQLAQMQSLATAGQASASTAIGSVATTLNFQFGTISGGTLANGVYSGASFAQDPNQSSGSVSIDSSNNSLQGIRDAINKAGLGVTATIVADGSASPYHLVLTSNKTGVTSSMKITVTGDPALQNLLAYDPAGTQALSQTSAAQNTLLTVNGIQVTSPSNTVTGAIQGVTLNTSKVGTTSLAIAQDTGAVTNNVNAFIKSYNDLNTTLQSLTAYNADTKTGGPLLGDSTVSTIQNSLRKIFSSPPAGLAGSLTNLSQIGVSFQKDGSLALDSTKLQAALSSNFSDVGKLFATAGTASDSLISYAGSTAATQAGSNAVTISALASKGQVTGSAAANTNIVAGTNDQLTLTIDGVMSTITLPAGAYSATSLSAQIQSAINGMPIYAAAGTSVSVTQINGIFSITSNRYGSASNVSVGGNGAADLLGATPTATAGTDTAGTINGVAALGSGQFLTGATGTSADGLKIQVTGGSLGARGTVNFSQGYAALLGTLVGNFLGSGGLISGRTDGLNQSIKDIGNQRDTMNNRLTDIEARYRAQFTALDVMIGQMNSTSSYLTQQLAAIANLNKQ